MTNQLSRNVTTQVSAAMGRDTKIAWGTYNWPSKMEWFALIHFDLVELREKRDAGLYAMIKGAYNCWLALVSILCLNFLTTIVLTATAAPVYSGLNILYAIMWFAVLAVVDMVLVYQAYYGFAEDAARAKMIAKVLTALMSILLLLQAFGSFGNINGLAGLGGRKFEEAADAGVSGATVSYWQAMSVMESLLWCGDLAGHCWLFYRLVVGPAAVQGPNIPTITTKPASGVDAGAGSKGASGKSSGSGSSSSSNGGGGGAGGASTGAKAPRLGK